MAEIFLPRFLYGTVIDGIVSNLRHQVALLGTLQINSYMAT